MRRARTIDERLSGPAARARREPDDRVFCDAPGCPLCRRSDRLTNYVRVFMPWRVFKRVQRTGVNPSVFIRRLLQERLHRPEAREIRRKLKRRRVKKRWPAGVNKYVWITAAMHAELKSRRPFYYSLLVRRELCRLYLEHRERRESGNARERSPAGAPANEPAPAVISAARGEP